MRTVLGLGIIAAALFAGCGTNSDPMHQMLMGKSKEELDKFDADRKARWDKEDAHRKAEWAKLERQLAQTQAFAKRFCAKTPMERDAYAREVWEGERNRPGSKFISYGDVRYQLLSATHC